MCKTKGLVLLLMLRAGRRLPRSFVHRGRHAERDDGASCEVPQSCGGSTVAKRVEQRNSRRSRQTDALRFFLRVGVTPRHAELADAATQSGHVVAAESSADGLGGV